MVPRLSNSCGTLSQRGQRGQRALRALRGHTEDNIPSTALPDNWLAPKPSMHWVMQILCHKRHAIKASKQECIAHSDHHSVKTLVLIATVTVTLNLTLRLFSCDFRCDTRFGAHILIIYIIFVIFLVNNYIIIDIKQVLNDRITCLMTYFEIRNGKLVHWWSNSCWWW